MYGTPIVFLLDGLGGEGDAWEPEPLPRFCVLLLLEKELKKHNSLPT